MKKNYLRIISLTIICLLSIQTSLSQSLTFSDFMHITSIENLSELNDYLSTKGYKYAGSNSQNGKTMAYWTKNITYSDIHFDGTLSWDSDNNTQYGVLEIDKRSNNDNRIFSYYFPSKNTYNSILKFAKQNGYHFVSDGLDEDDIFKVFAKNKSNLDYIENLVFYERKNHDYFIQYYKTHKKGEPKLDGQGVYKSTTTMPSFPGGNGAIMNYINKHLQYPQTAKSNNIQGDVVVQFIVEKDGSVGEVKVITHIHPDLDEEAIRVCKSLPRFSPGKNENGDPVRVLYTIPVSFKLTNF